MRQSSYLFHTQGSGLVAGCVGRRESVEESGGGCTWARGASFGRRRELRWRLAGDKRPLPCHSLTLLFGK